MHMLERKSDGSYSIAYAGETPWHGLGKKVLPDLTPAQMLKEAGLDWTVRKEPAYISINKHRVPIQRSALIRESDNKILTITSDDWKEVQNHQAFDFFHEYVMAGDMEMHTAGALNDGQIVWALAKLKESFDVFKGDQIDSYLLFTLYHIYGKSGDVRFTPTRVVCNNTLNLALGQKTDMMVKFNHRHDFNPDKIKKTLGIAKVKLDKYKETAMFLGKKKYTEATLVEFLKEVFPSTSTKKVEADKMSRPASIAHDIIETQPGAEFAPGTWWNAFNSVTFTIDHLLGHNDNNRLVNSWYGMNRVKKNKALQKAVEFADKV